MTIPSTAHRIGESDLNRNWTLAVIPAGFNWVEYHENFARFYHPNGSTLDVAGGSEVMHVLRPDGTTATDPLEIAVLAMEELVKRHC